MKRADNGEAQVELFGCSAERLIDTGATFSADQLYRYLLWRIWNSGSPARLLLLLMLNPSTAGEVVNDPTVERGERRARMLGYDGLLVANIFAYRATDPAALKTATDPVGPENDLHIITAANRAALIVCAWGAHGKLRGRAGAVLGLLDGYPLHYLKLTKDGEPSHPLYLPYNLEPQLWGRINK
jgi:hypothetical protein